MAEDMLRGRLIKELRDEIETIKLRLEAIEEVIRSMNAEEREARAPAE
jgi:hypothetical protein